MLDSSGVHGAALQESSHQPHLLKCRSAALTSRKRTSTRSSRSQERVGRGGRCFDLFKLRTMEEGSGAGPQVTAAGDPRISRFGRHLRATKLDEPPQLFNVLRADMSLVGPRPEVPGYVRLWTEQQGQVVLSVRPGLTDPVTLTLRAEEQLLDGARSPRPSTCQECCP